MKLQTFQLQVIAEMVELDYMPLKLVEGKGFLNLMSILAPDYKVPSRNTVKFFM
jgi:hypothetical protein